jgi:hypothetical protein
MTADLQDPPSTERARPLPNLRLAFGAVFWRAFVGFVLVREVWLLVRIARHLAWARPWQRVMVFLYYSPRSLYYGMAFAAILTVAADALVRSILRRRVASWLSPRRPDDAFGTPLAFHLGPTESILAEIPARLAWGRGRRWRPGTLVVTDRRIGFFPIAWDVEPRLFARDEVLAIRVEPAHPGLGLVRGMPDRLVLRGASGEEATLAVAEPGEVLDQLDAHPAARYLHLD